MVPLMQKNEALGKGILVFLAMLGGFWLVDHIVVLLFSAKPPKPSDYLVPIVFSIWVAWKVYRKARQSQNNSRQSRTN